MKAIVFKERKFRLEDISIPESSDNEIRIRVRAIGFNPSDYQFRQELEKSNGTAILGGEVAGEIETVGKRVSRFKHGDEVYAYLPCKRSAYAEYVTVESDTVSSFRNFQSLLKLENSSPCRSTFWEIFLSRQ
jgi:NADPH:quinone reductase-like Zn-dependent oxidoreductase